MERIGEDPIMQEDMRFLGYRVGWSGGHRQCSMVISEGVRDGMTLNVHLIIILCHDRGNRCSMFNYIVNPIGSATGDSVILLVLTRWPQNSLAVGIDRT